VLRGACIEKSILTDIIRLTYEAICNFFIQEISTLYGGLSKLVFDGVTLHARLPMNPHAKKYHDTAWTTVL
jgi:hypothetical protein